MDTARDFVFRSVLRVRHSLHHLSVRRRDSAARKHRVSLTPEMLNIGGFKMNLPKGHTVPARSF